MVTLHELNEVGIFTKSQAFRIIKRLLEVPNNAIINVQFFNSFFKKTDDGRHFKIKMLERDIKELFIRKRIVELNKWYNDEKVEGRGQMIIAIACRNQIMRYVHEAFAT